MDIIFNTGFTRSRFVWINDKRVSVFNSVCTIPDEYEGHDIDLKMSAFHRRSLCNMKVERGAVWIVSYSNWILYCIVILAVMFLLIRMAEVFFSVPFNISFAWALSLLVFMVAFIALALFSPRSVMSVRKLR